MALFAEWLFCGSEMVVIAKIIRHFLLTSLQKLSITYFSILQQYEIICLTYSKEVFR
mgnify:CR=1